MLNFNTTFIYILYISNNTTITSSFLLYILEFCLVNKYFLNR